MLIFNLITGLFSTIKAITVRLVSTLLLAKIQLITVYMHYKRSDNQSLGNNIRTEQFINSSHVNSEGFAMSSLNRKRKLIEYRT